MTDDLKKKSFFYKDAHLSQALYANTPSRLWEKGGHAPFLHFIKSYFLRNTLSILKDIIKVITAAVSAKSHPPIKYCIKLM